MSGTKVRTFRIMVLTVGLLLTLAACGAVMLYRVHGPDGINRRGRCVWNLKKIAESCSAYARANGDRLPPDLSTIAPGNGGAWMCPTAVHDHGDSSAEALDSYVYLGAGLTTSVMGATILAHDRLENHRGKGINVLYADGTTEWLEGDAARALVNFPKPGTGQPMPLPTPEFPSTAPSNSR